MVYNIKIVENVEDKQTSGRWHATGIASFLILKDWFIFIMVLTKVFSF